MWERLRKLRKELGLTQTEMGARIGCSLSTMCRLESGKYEISDYIVRLICVTWNVNRDWLVNGTGDMFTDASAALQYTIDDVFNRLKNACRRLTSEQQEAVILYIQNVAEEFSERSHILKQDDQSVDPDQ